MNKEKLIFYITIVSGLIILIIAAALSISFSKNKDDIELSYNRSIFNNKKSGYMAWHKIAKESGLKFKIWKEPFKNLSNINYKPSTMVIVSPQTISKGDLTFTSKDVEKLLNWIREGNTLIYVDDFGKSRSHNLINQLEIEIEKIKQEKDEIINNDKGKDKLDCKSCKEGSNYKDVYAEEKYIIELDKDHKFSFNAKDISSSSLVRLKDQFLKALITDPKGILLAERDYGKGEIYILTIPDLIDNFTLYEKEDNFQFFTNLVTVNGKDNVYINEYVHGYIKPETPFSYYDNTLIPPISKQILLVLFILIWSVSKRFGKTRPIKDSDRKNSMEYVNAMSNLYAQSGLSGTVLAPIFNKFKVALCRDLRIDLNSPDELIVETAKSTYNKETTARIASIISTVSEVIKEDKISKDDMVDLCSEMNDLRIKGFKNASRS